MCGREYLIVSWEKFFKAICKRFDSRNDIIKDFNKLIQEKSVEDYVKKFEELKFIA